MMRDLSLRNKLEADLRQYYAVDLPDLYRSDKTLTVRQLTVYVTEMPDGARIVKWILDDAFDTDQHLLASVVDLLRESTFQASISAAGAAGKEYKQLLKKRPKPTPRPTVQPKKKVPKRFMTTRELMGRVSKKKVIIAHTPACIKSEINGPGELNCSCPPREVTK